jgi:hypothetical protein
VIIGDDWRLLLTANEWRLLAVILAVLLVLAMIRPR